MSIQGTLDTFDLSSLLQMLKYERKTGRLTIRSKGNQVQIFLQDGDIVFATESRKNNRLGFLLMNHGLISRKALDTCLALSREKNLSIGKILVQQGYISLQQLTEFLLRQAENTIYNVFLWETGEFVYNDARLNMKEIVGGKFNTMNILLEASRRIDELELLKKQIPDERVVLRQKSNHEKNSEIELNEDEKRLLSVINGYSTVSQILEETGWDNFTGYKTINSLLSSGAIEIVRAETPEELAELTVSRLQEIDGRQFREILDHLELKRSSLLRVVLTRVFRDAADKNQLLESVSNEAGKITAAAEKAEMARLMENTNLPYINSLLKLLWQAAEEETADH